jgi:hypothetical protein
MTSIYSQPDGLLNVTISPRLCDIVIETNRSGRVTKETMKCIDGYEYQGPATTATEVYMILVLRLYHFIYGFIFSPLEIVQSYLDISIACDGLLTFHV